MRGEHYHEPTSLELTGGRTCSESKTSLSGPTVHISESLRSLYSALIRVLVHDIREPASCQPTPESPFAPIPDTDYAVEECPADILDTALLLITADEDIQSSPYEFYEFWSAILEHMFPLADGYIVSEDWELPDSRGETVNFAVFEEWGFPNEPFAVLQVASQKESNSNLLRATAAQEASHIFDALAPYSSYDYLLVISAMGVTWKGLRESRLLSSSEAEGWLRNSDVEESGPSSYPSCDWFESVVSRDGWSYLKGMIKRQKQVARGSPRQVVHHTDYPYAY